MERRASKLPMLRHAGYASFMAFDSEYGSCGVAFPDPV